MTTDLTTNLALFKSLEYLNTNLTANFQKAPPSGDQFKSTLDSQFAELVRLVGQISLLD